MSKNVIISCGIFKKELEKIKKQYEIEIDIVYLNSMMHIYPKKLNILIEEKIKNIEKSYDEILLLYGDCFPNYHKYFDKSKVKVIKAMNCVEMFLGKEKYREYRKQGYFFLLPEWTLRWREVFQKELGLNQSVAKDMMNELHTKLMYVDTKEKEIPMEKLKEISEYLDMEYEILTINLDEFYNLIKHKIRG